MVEHRPEPSLPIYAGVQRQRHSILVRGLVEIIGIDV